MGKQWRVCLFLFSFLCFFSSFSIHFAGWSMDISGQIEYLVFRLCTFRIQGENKFRYFWDWEVVKSFFLLSIWFFASNECFLFNNSNSKRRNRIQPTKISQTKELPSCLHSCLIFLFSFIHSSLTWTLLNWWIWLYW